MKWIVASGLGACCAFCDYQLSYRWGRVALCVGQGQESEIQFVSSPARQVSYGVMKKFEELTEREVLALAIALEEEDERVYADFAEGLRQDYPATASMFDGMREEESRHRRRLLELVPKKFGEHISLIRRQAARRRIERPA